MTQSEELKAAKLDVSKCTGHKALDKIRKCKLHYSGGVIAWGLDFSYQELCIIEDAIERRMIEQKRKARPPLEHIEGLTEALETAWIKEDGYMAALVFDEGKQYDLAGAILDAAKLYADNMEKDDV